MPFLKRMTLRWDDLSPEDRGRFPYNIPALRQLEELEFRENVTFFTGDNGSGKSTLLEAIGDLCGFNIVGGKDTVVRNQMDDVSLTSIMRLQWLPKVNHGLYFRAETFDTFASYIDELARDVGSLAYAPYGGKSLHQRSHGQAFLTFFENRLLKKGLYLLDEPESALSPQNQLAFLRIIHDMEQTSQAQFIIATHSPILMAYPGAAIYHFQEGRIEEVAYEETEQYTLTRDFLNHRERYFRMLFE
ncbi:AAA family ATPase [Paenibacillus methanolicus]|uniref:Putative ATPase n=1 Tax=Paenibacillus methanolicus TaxID=582686 RepID=A0A5S5BU57_9BACL|nr:AAA family ATPase [Paenibacillus methanolicus]TYP69742.1 putative ATPase [Paenibacillus methanolicus]